MSKGLNHKKIGSFLKVYILYVESFNLFIFNSLSDIRALLKKIEEMTD